MYSKFFQVFEQPQPSFGIGSIFKPDFEHRRSFHRRRNNGNLLQKFPGLFNQHAELNRRETFYNHVREQKILKEQRRKELLEKKRRAEAQKQNAEVINSLFNFFQGVEEDDSYHSDSTSLADIVNNSDEEEEKSTTVIRFIPNHENDENSNDEDSDDEPVSTTVIHFTPSQNTLTYNEDCEMSEASDLEDSDENESIAFSDDDDEDEITDDDSSDTSDDDVEIEEASDSEVEFEHEASAEEFAGFSSDEEEDNTVELDSFLDVLNTSASVIENSINIFERLNRHSNGDYSDKESTPSSASSSDSDEISTETLILRSRIKVLENLRLELESQYNKLDSLDNPADADVKRFKHVLIGKAVEFADKSAQLANNLKERIASTKGNSVLSFEHELEAMDKAHSSETESESEEEQFSDNSSFSESSKPVVRRILIETLSDAALSD
ncbi:hypothetical protein D0Z00_003880 [Geotrichum galactomycetum]|uniref:Uncharacterized protein n=1 Tax=Geotrichum galactomycetum TaxID=27317 RepID=A0ACB6V020_9ASCO|nr:hypothetical protein D0Z00_003880 [Geotrichum candidum]